MNGGTMYVYVCSEPQSPLFTVGFYDPKGNWHPDSDHSSSVAAGNRVAFLNGNSLEVRANALEEAAALCDAAAAGSTRTAADRERQRTCLTLAAAIRELKITPAS